MLETKATHRVCAGVKTAWRWLGEAGGLRALASTTVARRLVVWGWSSAWKVLT